LIKFGDCSEDAVPWLQMVDGGLKKKLDESSEICDKTCEEDDEMTNKEPIDLLTMLSYMRPDGSRAQRKFCNRFLKPVFGLPDRHGNYTLIVGEKPKIAFMAHHDTVHKEGGKQGLLVANDVIMSDGQNCLGADCTTGVYIILKMIEAGIKGVYVVHAGEEIGCVGSRALVADHPIWMDYIEAAISFDRMGYESIITHQLGYRTCSEAFADSLEAILDMGFKSDDTGVYTDSNEYADKISECTNVSVGYFKQHSKGEYQDMVFVELLIERLLDADWTKLVFKRDPSVVEVPVWEKTSKRAAWGSNSLTWDEQYGDSELMADYSSLSERYSDMNDLEDMLEVIRRHPRSVARLIQDMGYNASGLIDDISNLPDEYA
jgi:hypothetical protein